MNALVPSRTMLSSAAWWARFVAVAVVAVGATVVSYGLSLTDMQISILLLLPGVGSALLARIGRSLWPALVAGDLLGQVLVAHRGVALLLGSVAVHAVACLLGATLLQRTNCWLRDLAQTLRFAGIAALISIAAGVFTVAIIAAMGDMPGDFGVPQITGWVITGYLAGFLVGGGFVLAWGDPQTPVREAFRQRIAMASSLVVTVVGAIGLLAEIGPLVPLALVGAIAIAGRSGTRWGTATILAIALVGVEGVQSGVGPAFGGQGSAEAAANGMLAMSLFAAAVITLGAYRTSGGDRQRSPAVVALIFAALMLVAGVTSLAANEVAMNRDTPYVLSGLLSLGAAIGIGVLRMSRTPEQPSTRRGLLLAAVAGAIYVLNLALYLEAVPLVGSGPATGLSMTAPVWVVAIGIVAYRKRPTLGVVAGVALILAGAIAFARDAVGDPTGITLALASAAVFAGSIIITQKALARAGVIDVALASALAAAVVALVIGAITEGAAAFDLTAAEYGALAMAALGAQLIPTLGRSWALSQISADFVGAEGVLAPVTTTLLSFWFLDAVTTGGDIAGLVLITAGAVVAALLGSRRTASHREAAVPPATPVARA